MYSNGSFYKESTLKVVDKVISIMMNQLIFSSQSTNSTLIKHIHFCYRTRSKRLSSLSKRQKRDLVVGTVLIIIVCVFMVCHSLKFAINMVELCAVVMGKLFVICHRNRAFNVQTRSISTGWPKKMCEMTDFKSASPEHSKTIINFENWPINVDYSPLNIGYFYGPPNFRHFWVTLYIYKAM